MTAVVGRALRSIDDHVEAVVRQLGSALAAESHHTLALRLTLLLVVLHGATSPFASVVVRVVALMMLVLPSLTHRAALWWLTLVALAASNADQWEIIDNHQYLITYWVLACTLTVQKPEYLAINARLLVGIAFGFAVLWKLAAGQYLDGSFFYVSFFTDGRLQNFAGLFADGGPGFVKQTSQAIGQVMAFGFDNSTLALANDRGLMTLARGMSWSGLVVETAVAIVHLLPERQSYALRHFTLMVFVAFTYVLLPVVGFGFLLGVMGFAQVADDDQRLKRLYIALLCFLQLSLVPWRNLLAVPAV